ncbi:signal peptidase II [Kiritimatiellaeota bacterium B1221]|nr:signal peptidase II [Kiritimatiellaeota bacterium B1221]
MADAPVAADSSPAGRPPRWPYLIALAAFVADQWSKKWVLATFENEGDVMELVPGVFNFLRTSNKGAAFSLFNEHPEVLTVLAMAVFCLMVIFRDKLFLRTRLEQWAFGLIAGGVIGNITDRLQYGHVIDFLNWYWGYDWPIFNLADSFICIGVGLYFLSQLRIKPQAA